MVASVRGPGRCPEGDLVINGFLFLGWVNGVLGCIPVIVLEVGRSLVLWMKTRDGAETESAP